MSERNHYLLTALGTKLTPTEYELGSQRVQSPAAPLALLQLLTGSARPNRVVVVLTPGAKAKTWDQFRNEFAQRLEGSDIVLEPPVEVPDGRSTEEIREILQKVADRFRTPCRLTIDVTHGFRHFPFIVYPLMLYLSSLRNVTIEGAYYGMIGSPAEAGPWPIISLEPLVRLPEWFYGVRTFREYGVTDGLGTRLSELFDERRAELQRQGQGDRISEEAAPLREAAGALGYFGSFYGLGLPLELGRAVRRVQLRSEQIRNCLGDHVPLGEELFELIADSLTRFAFDQARVPSFSGEWKRTVPLDGEELERQARLIEQYLNRRQFAQGLALLREWVISWVIWQRSEEAHWLEREVRQQAERYLGAADRLVRNGDSSLPEDLRVLGDFWNQLTQLRNQVAHNGMGPAAVEIDEETIAPITERWNELRRAGRIELPAVGGGGGTVLVTPQGQRKGVVFSALRTADKLGREVSRCLVVCSEQSKSTLNEAAEAAGFTGEIIPLVLSDPFAGFDELARISKETEEIVRAADELLANLTGGTTLMGIAIQRIVEQAQRWARPTLRFALVDRRPVDEQSAAPFVESEYYLLDEQTDATETS